MSQRVVSFFHFDDELLDELFKVADAMAASVAHTFCRSNDFEIARSLIAAAIVDGAVNGERHPRKLELVALQKLQDHFPALALEVRRLL
jgi:hypothetical protein